MIENSLAKILCLKRKLTVDTRPGYISNCAEHVKSGEDYKTAAIRALEEELGIKGKPIFHGTIRVYDEGHNIIIGCFKTQNEGAVKIDKNELDSAEFRDLEIIKKGIKNGEKYSPTFIKVIEKLYG